MPSWKCSISILLLLIYILDESKCSHVIDKYTQKSIYISEYCPTTEYCKEGTHVMCMFYDKDKEKGPHCLNSLNITITPELAQQLLEIINAMRSKLANGKEKGYKGELLPRAYGMPRLQWDEELATFAQVLANQCVLRHDLCRSTKRFPNPGQTASVVRFYYPDWRPLPSIHEKSPALKQKGFNQEKLRYAIRQSCLTWYKAKGFVTSAMILNPPDWYEHPHKRDGKLYLDMIAGGATHMGCGLSAYVDYSYVGINGSPRSFYDSDMHLTSATPLGSILRIQFIPLDKVNSKDGYELTTRDFELDAVCHPNRRMLIEVICNFSARPVTGTSVYYTSKAPSANPRSKCGCLVGYVEDEDCLCVEDPNYSPFPKSKMSCIGKNCVPAVVILPIIAMEDAPLHVLQQHNNQTRKHQTSLDLFNEDNSVGSVANKEAYSHDDFEKALQETRNDLGRRSELTNNNLWNVQQRYLPKKSIISQNEHETQGLYHVRRNPKLHSKASLFSKSNKFELPGKGQVIKDVLPRKDFTKVQNLVDIYFNKKRNFSVFKPRNDATIQDRVSPSSIVRDITSNVYTSNYRNVTNEDTDKKVLFLLDDLEQEVKHTDLADSEKKLLDDKLRKIYGRINNIPKNSMSSEKNHLNKADTNDFLKYENSVNKHLMEELQRNAHRNLYSIDNDKSSELSKNDVNMLSVKKRLLEKEINGNEDLRSLRKRLEKPINENEYSFNRDIKYNDMHKTRNINALIEFDPSSIKLRDIGKEANSDDIQHRRDIRKNEFKNERYRSKNYDDIEIKEYTNHLDDIGDLDYERRKYYQDKIDFLEEKLHKSRERQHHNKVDRQLRPIQSDRNDLQMRPNKKKTRKISFYLPGRARSVHEF